MSWIEKALAIHVGAADARLLKSEVIASNLAHASTPGYRSESMNYKKTMAMLDDTLSFSQEGLTVDRTRDEGRPASITDLTRQSAVYDRDGSTEYGKNTVNVAHEQAQFAKNSAAFDTTMTFLSMKVTGLRKAIEG